MGDSTPVGVKLAAGVEDHRVMATFGVGQLHAVADGERTGPSDVTHAPMHTPESRITVP